MRCELLGPLLYSSVWVAAAAAALVAAAALAMQTPPNVPLLGLAFCGTLFVYNVDRLRDLPRDRETAPERTAFVERNRRSLTGLAAAAGVGSILLALPLGGRALLVLGPVLAAGLLHRRLKRFVWWKPLYVSAAWTAVVVGLPARVGPAPVHVGWIAGVVGATVFGNVIASNVRDGEAASERFGTRVPLRIAAASALLAGATALAAPQPVRPLALLPALTLVALARFRPGECYGLLVVDGALLVGALLALPLLV